MFVSSIRSRTCLPVHLWFSSCLRQRCLAPSGSSIRRVRHSSLINFKRLEQFFEANSIGHYPADATAAVIQVANRKKVAVMISVIGKNTYGTLRDLCSPENPKDKTFDALRDLCSDILSPSDWKLWNRIDFTVVFKNKTKVFPITAPVLDIWLPRVILVNS